MCETEQQGEEGRWVSEKEAPLDERIMVMFHGAVRYIFFSRIQANCEIESHHSDPLSQRAEHGGRAGKHKAHGRWPYLFQLLVHIQPQ